MVLPEDIIPGFVPLANISIFVSLLLLGEFTFHIADSLLFLFSGNLSLKNQH
jgi:hypothetical protein